MSSNIGSVKLSEVNQHLRLPRSQDALQRRLPLLHVGLRPEGALLQPLHRLLLQRRSLPPRRPCLQRRLALKLQARSG